MRKIVIMVVAAAALITSACSSGDAATESPRLASASDEWRSVFAEFLDDTYIPEIGDEQVDAINRHYCADDEPDYMSHIETVAMSHLPSGAFEHASASTLATAAMVASAATAGCDGIADRDKVAAGMAERFRDVD